MKRRAEIAHASIDESSDIAVLKRAASKRARLSLDTESTMDAKIHRCTYEGCDKSFTKPSKLADHLRSHSGERPFCCSEPGCGKRFLRKSHLQAHAPSHMPKESRRFPCTEADCSQRFSTNQHLRQHLESHARPKLFSCDVCGLSFHKHYQQKRHLAEVHLQSKPCPCPHPGCNMSFSYPSLLNTHLTRVHDPNKRYGCEIGDCNEKFLKWSHLQTHIKECHQMRCPHCQKPYSDATALRLHVETHEVPLTSRLRFPCLQCDKKFTRANALKKHVAFVHEGIRDFACQLCEKEFAHKRTLKSHMVREHSDDKSSTNKTSSQKDEDVKEQKNGSLLNRLTGAEYGLQKRDIHCIKEGCAFQFTREYDFDRHIAAFHPELEITVEQLLQKAH